MGCSSQCVLGENLTFTIQARDGTGAPSDTDAVPTYNVYEDETSTAILSGSMAKLASKTGFYSEQIACTAANGFERFKSYTIRIVSAVNNVSVAKSYTFLCLGGEDTVTATTGALTTVANFQSYTGTSGNDTLVTALIARATSAIERYCNRTLRSDTYRERYNGYGSQNLDGLCDQRYEHNNQCFDGSGCTRLALEQYPVTNVEFVGVGLQDVLRIKNTSSDAYLCYVTVADDSTDASVSGDMTLLDGDCQRFRLGQVGRNRNPAGIGAELS
jgi:hypothetical protein